MDRFVHRGVTIAKRGRRWRWQVKVHGHNQVASAPDLESAVEHLDRVLDRRDASRVRRAAQGARPVSVAELLDDWFRYKTPQIAPATVQQYGIHIRVHVLPLIGDADANTVKPRDLEAFYSRLRWKSAKESHNILRQAFEWGLRNEILVRESNPCALIRPSRRTSTDHDGAYDTDGRIVPLTEKDIPLRGEVHKLLIDAEERSATTWWLYIKVAATSGARPGEVCALRRSHIDEGRRTVHIEWSADRVSGRIKRPKTPWSIRTLHLPASFFEEIVPVLPSDPDDYLFPSNTRPGAVSSLPCWNSRGVKRRLDPAIKRTGIKHFTPHALRHYAATNLLAAGAEPGQVARFLGHADDTLVRKRYANHIVDEAQRRIGELAARLTDPSF